MSKWFDNFLESEHKRVNQSRNEYLWVEKLIFRATKNVEIDGWSTRNVFHDGIPVLKDFNENRYEPHAIFIPEGTEFEVISTQGLASGCALVYWKQGKTWFSATHDDAAKIVLLSETEDEEPPRKAWLEDFNLPERDFEF